MLIKVYTLYFIHMRFTSLKDVLGLCTLHFKLKLHRAFMLSAFENTAKTLTHSISPTIGHSIMHIFLKIRL